jgi:hypothetical protein
MNNFAHRTRRLGASAALAALFTFGFAISPPGALAQETATTFTVSMDSLAPGVPQAFTETFTLEENARLVGFTWIERSGVLSEGTAEIEVSICGSNGQCADSAALGDTVFEAGAMRAVLEVTLLDSAAEGESGVAVGQLQFTQVVDDLPFTGIEVTQLAFWGIAVISVGAFVLRLARQTNEERT